MGTDARVRGARRAYFLFRSGTTYTTLEPTEQRREVTISFLKMEKKTVNNDL